MSEKFPLISEDVDEYIDIMAKRKGEILVQLFEDGFDPAEVTRLVQTNPEVSGHWDTLDCYYINFPGCQAAVELQCDLEDQGITMPLLEREVKAGTESEAFKRLYLTADQYDPSILEMVGKVYTYWSLYTGKTNAEIFQELDFYDMYNACSAGMELSGEYDFMRMLIQDLGSHRTTNNQSEERREH